MPRVGGNQTQQTQQTPHLSGFEGRLDPITTDFASGLVAGSAPANRRGGRVPGLRVHRWQADPDRRERQRPRTGSGAAALTEGGAVPEIRMRDAAGWHRMSLPTYRRYCAVHEAGHVVAGLVGGMLVTGARLVDDDGVPYDELTATGGRTHWDHGPTSTLLGQAVGLAAAEWAQVRWLRERGMATKRLVRLAGEASERDKEMLSRLIDAQPAVPCRLTAVDIAERADRLIGTHWGLVKDVANALAAQGTLGPESIREFAGRLAPEMNGGALARR